MLILTKKSKIVIGACIAFSYLVLFFCLWQIPDKKFHIYFFDVGQGDSIFIKTPENHQILIDGGPDNSVIEKLSDVVPFFDKSFDLVVLTHPHSDHLNGLIEVLKKYEVENVLITGVYSNDSSYIEFLNRIKNENIKTFIANADEDFLFSNVLLDVIYPNEPLTGVPPPKDLNNSSIAIRVVYGKNSILLTGDLDTSIESYLVSSNLQLSSDILKVGHHGSKNSSSPNFIKKVSPKVAVIQCGKDNSFGHPNPDTLKTLYSTMVENIYRTDLDGTVEFSY